MGIFHDLSLLPFDVLERKINESRSYEHTLVLQESRDDMLVEPLAEDLQFHLLLKFEVDEDLLKCERFENKLTQSFDFFIVEIVPQDTVFFVN